MSYKLEDLIKTAELNGYKVPLSTLLSNVIPSKISGIVPSFKNGPWSSRLRNLSDELPDWKPVIDAMTKDGSLSMLGASMDRLELLGTISAPGYSDVFKAYRKVPLHKVRVVIVSQEPYKSCDSSPSSVREFNKLPLNQKSAVLSCMLSESYCSDAEQGTQPDMAKKIPYATGCAVAYPDLCHRRPHKYEMFIKAVYHSYPNKQSTMTPSLDEWCRQGVLLMEACPILFEGSNHNPNVWSIWTSRVLATIAQTNPFCIFVVEQRSLKLFKKILNSANAFSSAAIISMPSTQDEFISAEIFKKINVMIETISQTVGKTMVPIHW